MHPLFKVIYYERTVSMSIQKEFFDFFKNLAANNHRDWFLQNKKPYDIYVKVAFAAWVEELISILKVEEPELKDLHSSGCIFRINRDVRFSKDKSPYKLHASAFLAPGGRKNLRYPGLYVELGPEKLVVAGGAYFLEKEDLFRLRSHIMANASAWTTALSDELFVGIWGEAKGEANKKLPAEFAEQAKTLDILYKKQLYYWQEYPVERALEKGLNDTVIKAHQAARHVRHLIKEALGV